MEKLNERGNKTIDIKQREKWLKKWLNEQAEKQREVEKLDCSKLMDWIDDNREYCEITYKYKPVIMLKGRCKGYIPDIILHFPMSDRDVILDFMNPYSPYFSREKVIEKKKDLRGEGFVYEVYKAGVLTGKDPKYPMDFLYDIADDNNFIYAKEAIKYGANTEIFNDVMNEFHPEYYQWLKSETQEEDDEEYYEEDDTENLQYMNTMKTNRQIVVTEDIINKSLDITCDKGHNNLQER